MEQLLRFRPCLQIWIQGSQEQCFRHEGEWLIINLRGSVVIKLFVLCNGTDIVKSALKAAYGNVLSISSRLGVQVSLFESLSNE